MISPGYGQSARAMLFKSVPTGERFSQKRWILRLTWNQWHNDFGTLRGNLINLLIISDKIRYKRSSTAPVRIDNSFHDLLHPLPPFLFQNRTIFPTFRVILDPLEAGGQSIHGALHFFLQKIERSFHVSINSRSTNRDLAQGSFPSGWSETRDTLSRYGQRENENEGTRLHTTTRLAIDFWLPNKSVHRFQRSTELDRILRCRSRGGLRKRSRGSLDRLITLLLTTWLAISLSAELIVPRSWLLPREVNWKSFRVNWK